MPSPELDPVDFLAGSGLPRFAARSMSDTLRGAVTDSVCALLPGVERSPAASWLAATVTFESETAPELVRMMEPTIGRGHVSAVMLTALELYPICVELKARGAGLAGVRSGNERPQPSQALRGLRTPTEQLVAGTLGIYTSGEGITRLRSEAARAVRVLGEGDASWGGWALLAAVTAIVQCPDLPEPGRKRWRRRGRREGAAMAGQAHLLGRAFTMNIALGLLDGSGRRSGR